MNDEEDEDDEDDEWKKGISDKELEKTDKMIDDLIDMIDDKRDDLSLDFITKLTKYFKNFHINLTFPIQARIKVFYYYRIIPIIILFWHKFFFH